MRQAHCIEMLLKNERIGSRPGKSHPFLLILVDWRRKLIGQRSISSRSDTGVIASQHRGMKANGPAIRVNLTRNCDTSLIYLANLLTN